MRKSCSAEINVTFAKFAISRDDAEVALKRPGPTLMQSVSAPTTDEAMQPYPSLKLIYLDHHYWRAECARLALFMSGIPFEDARMNYDEMYGSGALTFGTFPALVVGGTLLAGGGAAALEAVGLGVGKTLSSERTSTPSN